MFFFRLALDEVSISALGLDSPDQQPWVHVMLKYRMAAQNSNGKWITFSIHNVIICTLCSTLLILYLYVYDLEVEFIAS